MGIINHNAVIATATHRQAEDQIVEWLASRSYEERGLFARRRRGAGCPL